MIDWRTEYKAWRFAMDTVDDLMDVKPGLLTKIGWTGLQAMKHCLMAAWLGRNPPKEFLAK